jgi:hypothetical protein
MSETKTEKQVEVNAIEHKSAPKPQSLIRKKSECNVSYITSKQRPVAKNNGMTSRSEER